MEDAEIIELYFNRDERAIAETENKYGAYFKTISHNILGSDEDAKECVNSTFLNIWNSIPPQKPRNLGSYAAAIVRNISFNRYKKDHAQMRGGHETAVILDELSELISNGKSVEDIMSDRDIVQIINSFLGGLPEQKRSIFVLRYWYAEPISAIAKRRGMTVGSVTMQLKRMRGELRKSLEKGGVEIW